MISPVTQRWREHRSSYRPAGEPINTRAYEVAALAKKGGPAAAFVLQHHYSASVPAAKVEPRAHRRSWSGLPPMLVDRPGAYRVTVDGKRCSAAGLVQLIKLGFVRTIRRRWYVRGRFRLVCTPERLRQLLETILTAPSPARLEQAFQTSIRLFPWSGRIDKHRGVSPENVTREATCERGRELLRLRPLGRLVPRFDHRRRRLTIGRSSYRVARGYNGAGVRWAWGWAQDWARAVLKRRGVPAKVADDVWEWWFKYPHRALRALENTQPPARASS